MSEGFIGEIRLFAGNFAPRGWALCDGQLLATSSNSDLFSLLGTMYGGDGETTFGLPDLRGRVPMHAGTGPGLSPRSAGQKGGAQTVTLTTNQLPSHTHTMSASTDVANKSSPAGNVVAQSSTVDLYVEDAPTTPLAQNAVSDVGGNQAHPNLQPTQCVHFIISLFGLYPLRS